MHWINGLVAYLDDAMLGPIVILAHHPLDAVAVGHHACVHVCATFYNGSLGSSKHACELAERRR